MDWADPQEEPDEDTMSKVKVLYCRNLTATVTEESLRELFERYGKVERVKKIKDYAFVHFEERDQAVEGEDQNISQKKYEFICFSHDCHELPRVLWHKARDLTGQASVRQEEEGGDVEEERAAYDAGHGGEVKRILILIKLQSVLTIIIPEQEQSILSAQVIPLSLT